MALTTASPGLKRVGSSDPSGPAPKKLRPVTAEYNPFTSRRDDGDDGDNLSDHHSSNSVGMTSPVSMEDNSNLKLDTRSVRNDSPLSSCTPSTKMLKSGIVGESRSLSATPRSPLSMQIVPPTAPMVPTARSSPPIQAAVEVMGATTIYDLLSEQNRTSQKLALKTADQRRREIEVQDIEEELKRFTPFAKDFTSRHKSRLAARDNAQKALREVTDEIAQFEARQVELNKKLASEIAASQMHNKVQVEEVIRLKSALGKEKKEKDVLIERLVVLENSLKSVNSICSHFSQLQSSVTNLDKFAKSAQPTISQFEQLRSSQNLSRQDFQKLSERVGSLESSDSTASKAIQDLRGQIGEFLPEDGTFIHRIEDVGKRIRWLEEDVGTVDSKERPMIKTTRELLKRVDDLEENTPYLSEINKRIKALEKEEHANRGNQFLADRVKTLEREMQDQKDTELIQDRLKALENRLQDHQNNIIKTLDERLQGQQDSTTATIEGLGIVSQNEEITKRQEHLEDTFKNFKDKHKRKHAELWVKIEELGEKAALAERKLAKVDEYSESIGQLRTNLLENTENTSAGFNSLKGLASGNDQPSERIGPFKDTASNDFVRTEDLSQLVENIEQFVNDHLDEERKSGLALIEKCQEFVLDHCRTSEEKMKQIEGDMDKLKLNGEKVAQLAERSSDLGKEFAELRDLQVSISTLKHDNPAVHDLGTKLADMKSNTGEKLTAMEQDMRRVDEKLNLAVSVNRFRMFEENFERLRNESASNLTTCMNSVNALENRSFSTIQALKDAVSRIENRVAVKSPSSGNFTNAVSSLPNGRGNPVPVFTNGSSSRERVQMEAQKINEMSDQLRVMDTNLTVQRAALQALQSRYDNLTTEQLFQAIMNEMRRWYPDPTNFQRATSTIRELSTKIANIERAEIETGKVTQRFADLIDNHTKAIDENVARLGQLQKTDDDIKSVIGLWTTEVKKKMEDNKKEYSDGLNALRETMTKRIDELSDLIKQAQLRANEAVVEADGTASELPHFKMYIDLLLKELKLAPVFDKEEGEVEG
ncbi:MAG: hypothetical protein M1820_010318 [Bogoriella megaspora]|nr:MAG: hypothetical protein M1820_010318 [Bogoriella megaspora]